MEPVEDETFNIYIINFPMHEVYFGWLNWRRESKNEKRKNTIYELHPPKEREREAIVRDSIKETKEDYVKENETDK